jgi:amidohydrolase
MDKSIIQRLADKYFPEILEIRRKLHQYPELSFREFKTQSFIKGVLEGWGLKPLTVAGTGVFTDIEGARPGPYVVLRADMDALPIEEDLKIPYVSRNHGVMHACGHDVHMSSLLGTIRILKDLEGEIAGRVRFVFQPGEELLPGGAYEIIKSGILDNPRPDFILGQHVFPELNAGEVGFRPGQYMASTDEIYLEVTGTGGHAAMPNTLIDPVFIASNLVVSLQQIVSRKAPSHVPTVLSFGKFEAKGATNVIPEKVKLEGTFRTMDEEWRAAAIRDIKTIATGMVESMGGKIDCKIVGGYPSLVNDKGLTAFLTDSASDFLGLENVKDLDIRMTGEDFARYSQIMPACFYRLGTAFPSRDKNFPVHHPKFEPNEDSIKTGMSLMAYLAIKIPEKD